MIKRYRLCPHCGSTNVARERRPNGDEFVNIVRNKAIEYWNNRVNNEQD